MNFVQCMKYGRRICAEKIRNGTIFFKYKKRPVFTDLENLGGPGSCLPGIEYEKAFQVMGINLNVLLLSTITL